VTGTITPDEDVAKPAFALVPLSEVRKRPAQTLLTASERVELVEQVSLMIETVFVHRHQKRAMYGTDPSRRLQLLRLEAGAVDDHTLHTELSTIIDGLRDAHTMYYLPATFRGGTAWLQFAVRRCWEGERQLWQAVALPLIDGDEAITVLDGAEVTHWNGIPIDVAIARNAEREVGNNPAARRAQGVLNLTVRALAVSPIPDEDWVDLRFLVEGQAREQRIEWLVIEPLEPPTRAGGTRRVSVAVDRRTDTLQRFLNPLLPTNKGGARSAVADDVQVGPIEATNPIATARHITTPNGTFGYLQSQSFMVAFADDTPMAEAQRILDEIVQDTRRMLDAMPRDGLIIDVRSNGGGVVYLAEMLLQMLTPRHIQPTPFQVTVSEQMAALCRATPQAYERFAASTEQGLLTGSQYSATLPFNDAETLNADGQRYQGPVVLITDALSFSATDIFAAAFQSHGIGPILGVDENTGAGGATVQTMSELHELWPDGPFHPLPGGAELTVAVARALRVGPQAGQPLEDLGVVPDHLHRTTRRDVLEGDPDLFIRAGELLAAQRPDGRMWSLDVEPHVDGITITTENLSQVDVHRNGRPVQTVAVTDGMLDVPVPAGGLIRVEGYDGDRLVVARHLSSGG